MNIGLHHLQTRKEKKELPHPDKMKRFVDNIAYLAIIAPLLTLPQLFVIFRTHNAVGISLITWGTYCFGAAFWSVYGILHKEKQIIYPNVLMTIVDAGIIVGILMYR